MMSSKIIIIIITELRPRNQTLLINCPEINYQNSIVKNFVVIIDHLTVVCLVAWPLYQGEAGVELVMIETSLPFLC